MLNSGGFHCKALVNVDFTSSSDVCQVGGTNETIFESVTTYFMQLWPLKKVHIQKFLVA